MFVRHCARAALVALFVLPTAAVAAPATPSLGTEVAYQYDFEGWFWNAQHTEAHHTLTLALVDGVVRPRLDPARPAAAARADAEAAATAAALLAHAPQPLRRDAHWTTTVPLGVGENGDDRIDVPVEVRVVAEQADGVTLQAVGNASGHASGGGYRSPVDVRVRLAAHVGAAIIDQLREAVEEDVHAGPYSQTMRWNWKLATTK